MLEICSQPHSDSLFLLNVESQVLPLKNLPCLLNPTAVSSYNSLMKTDKMKKACWCTGQILTASFPRNDDSHLLRESSCVKRFADTCVTTPNLED